MNRSKDLSVTEIRRILAMATSPQLPELLSHYSDDPRAGIRAACVSASARVEAANRERERTLRLYQIEAALKAQGYALIAGVDEVGRGALAGPMTVAAVVLPDEPLIEGLDDSKRLTPARRSVLAEQIRATAYAYSVSHVEAWEIDGMGVTAALKKAVLCAIAGLGIEIDHLLIDGLPLRVVEHETAVVKGDAKVAAIAAASILAKVTRDHLMTQLDSDYPDYAFAVNKGYGTPEHLAAIARCGLTTIHRRSFSSGGGTPQLF
ncbi:MAG: ribonuclease HII [Coriobacteriia bacterium]|nr:ribonuclease HII [Coriobacteriia bacterium]